MGYQNDLIQKKLISSRFQVLGIIASSSSLLITSVLVILVLMFKGYKVIPVYVVVFFTQSISLLSYLFFWKSIKVATVFIWLGALSILILSYPSIFFFGLIYLPSAILALVAAIGSLKPNNRWLWTGAITTMLALGFAGIRLSIIRQTSSVEPQETLFYIVILLQMLGLVGYALYIRLIGKIFIWLSVLAIFSLAVFDIYETVYDGGILFPFYSLLLTFICTKGALRASSNFTLV